jgi:hypothetical protein
MKTNYGKEKKVGSQRRDWQRARAARDNWFTRQERDVFLVTKAKKWLRWLER